MSLTSSTSPTSSTRPTRPTIEAAQYRLAADLRIAGCATPALDARLLTRFAVGFDETTLIAKAKQPIGARHLKKLKSLAKKRLAGCPVSRLMGVREFYSLPFQLNTATFDPRPESEHLVTAMIEKAAHFAAPRILDLGTGSGCLLIACLKHIKTAYGLGVDISRRALRQARINAAMHGLRGSAIGGRAFFRQSNWLRSINMKQEQFALILCNPPYIPNATIAQLAPEVRFYDPMRALAGGADGLGIYRLLGFEIGQGQADYLVDLLKKYAFSDIEVKNDLAEQPRLVLACKP
ncbi:MAG: peptide chain release factor N(5)-glutamine methyltransferase [Alphaproteobacteria bacterium]|nr:peptide chain release factor N(5)-glutamine methyltransferase [Alphaproteobacteria bacterium]